MTKRIVSIPVVNDDAWDVMPGWPDHSKLSDFREWLNGVEAKVPEAFRDSITIFVDSEGGWEGEHHATICISYSRPETDEEVKERIALEKSREAAAEARRRAEYERLKSEFE